MASGRPAEGEYAPFYARYVALVPEDDAVPVLEQQVDVFRALASVSRDRETFSYAPGKWSVRQVIGHIADGERVFGHRAFCISRGERAPLPSFDENEYVARSVYAEVALVELVDELVATRQANLAVLRRVSAEDWTRVGVASGQPVTVRALAYVMAGHPRHHLTILRERYGLG
jgi:DinB superfamily